LPDVSVVTPSYGYAHYLRDAIESVAEQRGVTVEHVIQDGASTDGTVELLRELDDLVDWTSEPDEGQSDALNRAFALSSGRWIGTMFPGNIIPSSRISTVSGATRVSGSRQRTMARRVESSANTVVAGTASPGSTSNDTRLTLAAPNSSTSFASLAPASIGPTRSPGTITQSAATERAATRKPATRTKSQRFT